MVEESQIRHEIFGLQNGKPLTFFSKGDLDIHSKLS